MPCFHPKKAWASVSQLNPKTGRRFIRFRECNFVGGTEKIKVPCGSCDGCHLDRARNWAIRCWHEASLYENNVFITLTFAPSHLDSAGSLRKVDFQKFLKRLRKKFVPSCPWEVPKKKGGFMREAWAERHSIRYFHCGEYGEKLGRPHHHACLFNFTFPDLELLRITDQGHRVYVSQILAELWPYGIHEIGEVTYQSAAYVARYIIKKVKGPAAWRHYKNGDIEPEYVTMSRNPGIGTNWLKKFADDVYPHDHVVMEDGFKALPPKFYDKKYELTNPEGLAILKKARVERAKNDPHNTPERLAVREELLQRRLKLLKRGYEKNED